jgi:hypothetical protein
MRRVTIGSLASALVLLVSLFAAPAARATTISFSSSASATGDVFRSVTSTGAVLAAGDFTATSADGTLSGSAVADVAHGHLGAFAQSNYNASVTADAGIQMDLGIGAGATTMTIAMNFAGAFAHGSEANVSLVDSDLGGLFGITCRPTIVGYCAGGDNFSLVQGNPLAFNVVVPLAGVDALHLTFLLQATTAHSGTHLAPATADILNSLDFTIIVPDGTVILNDPRGTLFRTESQGSTDPQAVPEPSTAALLGGALLVATVFGRRRRLQTPHALDE